MLGHVVSSGTGRAAQAGDEFIWGKTGTTENYGDAWFVGGNEDLTVAIWVGYADKLQPMEFEHAGSPVAGGTFPAEIFHDFMNSWLEMREERRLARGVDDQDEEGSTAPALPALPSDDVPSAEEAPTDTAPADETDGDQGGEAPDQAPQEPAPEPEPAPTPAPPPTPPPGGGDGGGGAGPGAAG
jgi:penicillin-binding protein 1A